MGGVRACLRACGMNEEVVQLVVCLPDVAETITRNPLVKHITCEPCRPGMNTITEGLMWQSSAASQWARRSVILHWDTVSWRLLTVQVALAAAGIMVPTCIELGGKDPAFLLPSANLKQFASTWLRGAL